MSIGEQKYLSSQRERDKYVEHIGNISIINKKMDLNRPMYTIPAVRCASSASRSESELKPGLIY